MVIWSKFSFCWVVTNLISQWYPILASPVNACNFSVSWKFIWDSNISGIQLLPQRQSVLYFWNQQSFPRQCIQHFIALTATLPIYLLNHLSPFLQGRSEEHRVYFCLQVLDVQWMKHLLFAWKIYKQICKNIVWHVWSVIQYNQKNSFIWTERKCVYVKHIVCFD